MIKNLKLNRQIYFILSIVLLLALVIQTTRLESILDIGRVSNEKESLSFTETINPLSTEEISILKEEKVLLLYDPEEVNSVRTKGNADRMLTYMKKKHDIVSVAHYQGSGAGYESIIMAFSDLEKLPNNTWVEQFVEQGGRILFAAMPQVNSSLYRIYRKLGINELGNYVQSEGLILKSNILISYKDEEFSSNVVVNTSLQLQLSSEANIHAVAKGGLPLLWDIAYGNGTFIVFNGTMLQEKSSRGILTGAIVLLKEDNLYPIINVKLMYIDDFPSPVAVTIHEDIYRIYKRNVSRFFKEVWWPDMIRLGSRYNLKYTGMVIQKDSNNTKTPLEGSLESDNHNLVTFGRELLKKSGEIGINGYNDQPLTLNSEGAKALGHTNWDSISSMTESIQTVVGFVLASFPKYKMSSYVPPSNILSAEGREALVAAWPDLKSISSDYSEDPLGLRYVQEFEVALDGIVEMPRITSGFSEDQFNQWAMANAASSIGVFSHSVIPDDILKVEETVPTTWEELYETFSEFLDEASSKYGWLRNMTATEASREIQRYTMSEPHFDYQPNRIEGFINQYTGGSLYYILRTNKKITREENCKIIRIDHETYLVEVEKEHFVIGLGG